MPDLAQHTTEPRSLPLTQALGRFVAELAFERLPEPALRTARMGFIDCTGTMIAGSPEPAVQILKKTLAIGGAGEAMLYFSSERGPAPEAAWINGTAAHALDYDDVALRGHPSTVLVPAILAEGEALHASGRDMLRAYAAGYEVWAELAERDRGQHHMKGWHPTGIFGAIGAAAACSALRRLDADRATLAIALAASQSSGLMANFGTMTKPYHAGWPRPASPHRRTRSSTPRASSTPSRPRARSTAGAPLPRSGGTGASPRSASASRSSPPATARTAASTACSISCPSDRSTLPGSTGSPCR
jgi:hypothetical protein